MRRLQLALLALCIVALIGCAAVHVGPRRSFNNWELATAAPASEPTITETPTSPPANLTTTQQPTLPSPTALPTTTVDRVVEYEYPTPVPFSMGSSATEYGIQINGCDRDVKDALAIVKRMGLTWIKQQARWADIERTKSVFDWSCLDRVIVAAHDAGFKVLISVTTSPAFARQPYASVMHPTNGRPDDFRDLALFLANLIARYPKQIQAIEVWNEPNLMREWGDVIDGGVYAQMLAAAYGVIKFLDPDILVISAGIALAGFTDVWDAMDDTVFMRGYVDYQGVQYADCIGAHANGPEGSGDIDTLATRYFDLTSRTRPICVTEFGYALPVDNQAPAGFDWIMSHTPAQQEQVLTDGLRWAKQSGFTWLVILWNLNFDGPHADPNAPYALVRASWVSPAIDAIASLTATSQP